MIFFRGVELKISEIQDPFGPAIVDPLLGKKNF